MSAAGSTELGALALSKLSRVLGAERARGVLESVLRELSLGAIETPDDLARVADALQRRSGFEATVGALLGVDAALRKLHAQ